MLQCCFERGRSSSGILKKANGAVMRYTSVFCTLLLLVASSIALPEDEPYIDLTWHFSFSATSVCGDPPTQFEYPQNSGQLQSCNGSDYSEEKALDRNSSTRWQSANGETPVEISFTLEQVWEWLRSKRRGWLSCKTLPLYLQPAVSLSLAGIRITVDGGLPRYLYLEERTEQMFTTLEVYVLNLADCAGTGENCSEFTVEEVRFDRYIGSSAY